MVRLVSVALRLPAATMEGEVSTYMMRQIDNELMRKARTRATEDSISIRGLLIWLLELYVKRGLTAFEAIDGKYPR